MLFALRGLSWSTNKRMLTILICVIYCIHSGKTQTCSEGFTYDRRARQCIDIDECRTLPDPCRGDMRCVNQNGGYLCIPRGLYSQSYARNSPRSFPESSYPEASYPDRSVGYPEPFVPNAPPVGAGAGPGPGPGPSYPIVSRSAPCILGYTAGADGTCVVAVEKGGWDPAGTMTQTEAEVSLSGVCQTHLLFPRAQCALSSARTAAQIHNMTECIKNCCRKFMAKEKEPETQIIKVRPLHTLTVESNVKKSVGVSEDYLLSKLPPDGREVPFVLPTFKPSYIQPRGAQYPGYNIGQQSSTRTAYAERKAELAGASQTVYDPDLTLNTSQMINYASPGSLRRPTLKTRASNSPGTGWENNSKQRLSHSMFDLSNPQGHVQRYDSVSSIQSSTSSIQDSFGSSRSLESITLSGDERDREPGKVCVHLRYEEAVEQVWITLVKCTGLNVYTEGVEPQRIGVKGVITMTKQVRFKSTVKEASADTVFMETFVFTLNLEQIRRSALVLRLQAHTPRKRTLGECVLSLRTLGPQETQHWLDFRTHSKTHVCHAELQLALCFQPVSSRMQLQILSAQNLPSSSSPLTQSFFVKVDMLSDDRFLLKRKTKVMKSSGGRVQWGEVLLLPITSQDQNLQLSVKLYRSGSVRRKHLLGQVLLGFDSSSPEAVEQWRDSMTHPEKLVTSWHRVSRP